MNRSTVIVFFFTFFFLIDTESCHFLIIMHQSLVYNHCPKPRGKAWIVSAASVPCFNILLCFPRKYARIYIYRQTWQCHVNHNRLQGVVLQAGCPRSVGVLAGIKSLGYSPGLGGGEGGRGRGYK